MRGFLFFPLTISLLVMIQIQTGVLQEVTTPMPGTSMPSTTVLTTQVEGTHLSMATMYSTSSNTFSEASPPDYNTVPFPNQTRSFPNIRPTFTISTISTVSTVATKSGAPTLSNMACVNFLFFLTNTLIYLS